MSAEPPEEGMNPPRLREAFVTEVVGFAFAQERYGGGCEARFFADLSRGGGEGGGVGGVDAAGEGGVEVPVVVGWCLVREGGGEGGR